MGFYISFNNKINDIEKSTINKKKHPSDGPISLMFQVELMTVGTCDNAKVKFEKMQRLNYAYFEDTVVCRHSNVKVFK